MRPSTVVAVLCGLLAVVPGVAWADHEVTWNVTVPDAPGTPAPPPLQPLEVLSTTYYDEIALPDGFTLVGVDLGPDDEHWLLEVDDGAGSQAALARTDGSDFRCLTCGLVPNAQKLHLFEDGTRLWFADSKGQNTGPADLPIPGVGGTGDFQWSVLECTPSLLACDTAEVLEVDFPIDSLTTLPVGAQNREATPDALGEFIAWNEVRTDQGTRVSVARLERLADRYALTDTRVVQPQYSFGDDPRDWVLGGRFYEGGKFPGGNRYIKYQATRTAVNYETGLLDLATGEYRFMTQDLDYNETGEVSPDGRWFDYSSARGLDRMDAFTQLVRPPFIDAVSFGQLGRVGLFNNRRCMNEAWLMDVHGQREDGYGGQPLVTEDNWLARKRMWVEGTSTMLVDEQLLPNVAGDLPVGRTNRLRLIRFPMMEVGPTLEPVDLDTVDWDAFSVPAADYTGMPFQQVNQRTVAGRAGGTATFQFSGSFAAGTWRVTFDGYSDDGLTFVSGTESLSTPNPIVGAVWELDLTATGERAGFSRGRVFVGPQNTFEGEIETEVAGQRWDTIPTQADCPGVLQAPLALEFVAAGDGALTLRVVAELPEDPVRRPVHGARVTAGDVDVASDADGRVTVPYDGSSVDVVAAAGGFRTAALTVDDAVLDGAAAGDRLDLRAASDPSEPLAATGGGWLLPATLLLVVAAALRRRPGRTP